MRLSTVLLLVLLWGNVQTVHAEMVIIEGDGNGYDVVEPDKTREIAKKTEDYLQSNKPARPENGIVILKNPPTPASDENERRIDVTYTYPQDVADQDGKILRKKGHRYNPLVNRIMPSLIVIGDDESQLLWAEKFKKEHLGPTTMIVLSAGNWLKTRQTSGIQVFQLTDRLQERLQINHVPCTVVQDGTEVVVHEYRPEDIK